MRQWIRPSEAGLTLGLAFLLHLLHGQKNGGHIKRSVFLWRLSISVSDRLSQFGFWLLLLGYLLGVAFVVFVVIAVLLVNFRAYGLFVCILLRVFFLSLCFFDRLGYSICMSSGSCLDSHALLFFFSCWLGMLRFFGVDTTDQKSF
ncbi:hypothetical protein BDV06DRAFT_69995 [Aspergillus oleicola]